MSIERIIGIDFGTSTSVIRIKRYEDKNPVGDRLYVKEVKFGNNGLVPTLIRHIRDGEPYYGYDAQKKHKNSVLLDNFKVDLESMDAEKKSRARALTEEFFTYLARQYKDQSEGGFFGDAGDIERTLVSYPVKWSEETRSFMLEAARKAGFPNVEGMDEAQAAIGAVMVQSLDYLEEKRYLHDGQPVNILMADMGAGTTDLVLCRYTAGENPKYEMLSTWPKGGSTLFGGREIERFLMEYLRGKLPDEYADAVMERCSLEKFKSWKEEYVSPALKRGEAVTEFADLDMITELLEIEMEDYALDREELEKLAVNYLRGFPRLVNGCLKDAGIHGSEVDLVLLTGGHSQWYFVAEQLSGRISQCGEIELDKIRKDPGRIIPVPLPQETVALGLVYSPMVKRVRFAEEAPQESKSERAAEAAQQTVQSMNKQTEQSVDRQTKQSVDQQIEQNVNRQTDLVCETKNESYTSVQPEQTDSGYTPDNEFELGNVGEDYYIRKYIGKRKRVSIPPVIRGRKVVAIGERAFSGTTVFTFNYTMEKVIIPNTVKKIESGAFANCKKLSEIVAHPFIEIIGSSAFLNCHRLQTLDFGMGSCSPKAVKFPPALKEIGGGAFSDGRHINGCILREVTLSKKTKIKNDLLYGKTFSPKYCAVFYYKE